MAFERGCGLLEPARRHVGLQLEEHGLVEVVRIGLRVKVEEPPLDRGQGHDPDGDVLLDIRRGRRVCGRGEGGDRLVLEDLPRREAQPGPVGPRHDLDAQDRVPAELEEVVVDGHPVEAQDLGPGPRQHLLGVRPRRLVRLAPEVASGAGSARRSTFPFGLSGSESSTTTAEGTMCPGSFSPAQVRSSLDGQRSPSRAVA